MDTDIKLLLPSPIQKISLDLLVEREIDVYIKRDDLIHEWISGNKYRKLKYNLINAKESGIKTIITFGGAFSNHIYAVAGACELYGLESLAFIRGEIDENNPTIQFCRARNMGLIPLSRSEYKLKEDSSYVRSEISNRNNYIIVPEGGSNKEALKGVGEIWEELEIQEMADVDYIALAGGTGGTAAGLLKQTKGKTKVLCFSVLKTDHLRNEILDFTDHENAGQLEVNQDFHFGGYAKWNPELLEFMAHFESQTGILLDHVYNAKAMYGLLELIKADRFDKKTKILYLHTGGLQGLMGLEYMRKNLSSRYI